MEDDALRNSTESAERYTYRIRAGDKIFSLESQSELGIDEVKKIKEAAKNAPEFFNAGGEITVNSDAHVIRWRRPNDQIVTSMDQ